MTAGALLLGGTTLGVPGDRLAAAVAVAVWVHLQPTGTRRPTRIRAASIESVHNHPGAGLAGLSRLRTLSATNDGGKPCAIDC